MELSINFPTVLIKGGIDYTKSCAKCVLLLLLSSPHTVQRVCAKLEFFPIKITYFLFFWFLLLQSFLFYFPKWRKISIHFYKFTIILRKWCQVAQNNRYTSQKFAQNGQKSKQFDFTQTLRKSHNGHFRQHNALRKAHFAQLFV